MNKKKCEILSNDKHTHLTSLEGVQVKTYVKYLGHHISADFKENIKIALHKCCKYAGIVAHRNLFEDSALNKVMKSSYLDCLLRFYIIPLIIVGVIKF